MEFRIGVNLGDVMVDGEQIYGDGVNVAERIESLAYPGAICISRTVHEHIRNKLALNYDGLPYHGSRERNERVWLAHFHVADHPVQLILIVARLEMSSPSLRLTSISLRVPIQFEGLLLRAFSRMSRLQGGRVTGWR
jgi:hypothetical protein